MSSEIVYCNSFADMKCDLDGFLRTKTKQIRQRLVTVANRGVKTIRRNVPVAFGELRDAIFEYEKENGARIEVDAPHALPVDEGSRPHMPPLAPILAWVKLRGMQALHAPEGKLKTPKRARRQTLSQRRNSLSKASVVGASFARYVDRETQSSSVDAPMKIARAIQAVIAKRGTRPHHYMEPSLQTIWRDVDRQMRSAMQDPP